MEEAHITPIHIEAARRAMRFEQKGINRPCLALRKCIEITQRDCTSHWAEERRVFCEGGGLSREWAKQCIEQGQDVSSMLTNRHIEVFQQLQSLAVAGLRYGRVRPKCVPLYLKSSLPIETKRLVARFRCENEERCRDGWRQNKSCRVTRGDAGAPKPGLC